MEGAFLNKFKKAALFNLILISILIFISDRSALSELAPPIPARIGGTITIDGKTCTAVTGSEGITIKVTDIDGSPYVPEADDSNGLNSSDWYLVDIPINEESMTAGEGAKSGDKAVIHLYKNGLEIKVLEPSAGIFTIGKSGSTSRIDIVADSKK